jgi:hypothetical protein
MGDTVAVLGGQPEDILEGLCIILPTESVMMFSKDQYGGRGQL